MPYIICSEDKNIKNCICISGGGFTIREPEVDRIQFILERYSNGDIFECEINNKLNQDIDIATVKKELEEVRHRLFFDKLLRKYGKFIMKTDNECNKYYLYLELSSGEIKKYNILMKGFNCEMFSKEMEKYIEEIHEIIKSKGYYILESNSSSYSDFEKSIKDAYKEKYGIELKKFYSETTDDAGFVESEEKIPEKFKGKSFDGGE